MFDLTHLLILIKFVLQCFGAQTLLHFRLVKNNPTVLFNLPLRILIESPQRLAVVKIEVLQQILFLDFVQDSF
jgi:hypothetical protein